MAVRWCAIALLLSILVLASTQATTVEDEDEADSLELRNEVMLHSDEDLDTEVAHSRQKRWFIRHIKKAVSHVGRAIASAAKVVYKAVVSGPGRIITSIIAKVNSVVGKTCCTIGLAFPPFGPACCGVSRITAGVTCAAQALQAVDSATKYKFGGARSSVRNALKSCKQAIYGFGRKRRAVSASGNSTTQAAPLPAGAAFMPKDLVRLRIMLCSANEAARACIRYRSSQERLRRVFRIAQLPLLAVARTVRDPRIAKALDHTSCSDVAKLPVCHVRRLRRRMSGSKAMPTRVDMIHDHNPTTRPCRLVNPRHRFRPTKGTCGRRLAFASARVLRILMLIEGDTMKMYPKEFPPKEANIILQRMSGHATR